MNAKNRRFIPLKRLKMSICGGSLSNEIAISISGSLIMIFYRSFTQKCRRNKWKIKKILHNNSNIDTRNYVAYYMDKVL